MHACDFTPDTSHALWVHTHDVTLNTIYVLRCAHTILRLTRLAAAVDARDVTSDKSYIIQSGSVFLGGKKTLFFSKRPRACRMNLEVCKWALKLMHLYYVNFDTKEYFAALP